MATPDKNHTGACEIHGAQCGVQPHPFRQGRDRSRETLGEKDREPGSNPRESAEERHVAQSKSDHSAEEEPWE